MTTRRTSRVNRAIQEAVSTAVLFKVKDPRVKNVTVLRAEATDDLRQAKVYVTVMGDEKRQALTMNGLAAARGFLQSKVADRLQTKQTPILTFVLDQSVKQTAAAQAALAHLFPVPDLSDLETDVDDLKSGSELNHAELSDEFDEIDEQDGQFADEELETEVLESIQASDATIIQNVVPAHENASVAGGPALSETAMNLVNPGRTSAVNTVDGSEPAELKENEDLPNR